MEFFFFIIIIIYLDLYTAWLQFCKYRVVMHSVETNCMLKLQIAASLLSIFSLGLYCKVLNLLVKDYCTSLSTILIQFGGREMGFSFFPSKRFSQVK